MDVQLQELITKIKEEGIQSAEEQGAEVIAKAEGRAAEIVAAAEARAEEIRETAKAEADVLRRTGNDALANAGRDLILSVRKRLEELFQAVMGTVVADALSGDQIGEAIVAVVKATADASDQAVQIAPGDLARIQSLVSSRLVSELQQGLEIQPLAGVSSGFRVSRKDGSSYIDFTDRGIAEILSQFLSPKFKAVMADAVKEE